MRPCAPIVASLALVLGATCLTRASEPIIAITWLGQAVRLDPESWTGTSYTYLGGKYIGQSWDAYSGENSLAAAPGGLLYTTAALGSSVNVGTPLLLSFSPDDFIHVNAVSITGMLEPPDVRSLAYLSGKLYAVNHTGDLGTVGESRRLYSIDPITGQSTFIRDLPYTFLQNLTDGPGGYLYAFNYGVGLFRIDPRNGNVFDVNPAAGGSKLYQSLDYGRDGYFYGYADGLVDRIHPVTGIVAGSIHLSVSQPYFSYDIRGIVDTGRIPEPGTLALVVLGAGLTFPRRKHAP